MDEKISTQVGQHILPRNHYFLLPVVFYCISGTYVLHASLISYGETHSEYFPVEQQALTLLRG